jgi:hypothetical protein
LAGINRKSDHTEVIAKNKVEAVRKALSPAGDISRFSAIWAIYLVENHNYER